MTSIIQPADPTVQSASTGAVVGWLNLDPRWRVEIERAPDDGNDNPVTSEAEVVHVAGGGDERFVDREIDAGETIHYRFRTNLPNCGAGAWTDWRKAVGEELPDVIPQVPTIQEVWALTYEAKQIDEDTGRLIIEVADPEKRLTAVEYNAKPGSKESFQGWKSDWSTSDGTTAESGTIGSDQLVTRREDIDLHEKHNSILKARFTYDTREGGSRTVVKPPMTMDRDRTPEFQHVSLRVGSGDGSVFVTARGDDDVATIYGRFAENTALADLTDPDGTETDGNSGEVNQSAQTLSDYDTDLDVSKGSTVSGKVRGENSNGTLGPVYEVRRERFDFDDEAEVNTLQASVDEADNSIIVSAGGDDDTDKIHIRVNMNSDPSDPDATTSDDATISSRSGTVDTGVVGNRGDIAHVKARGENADGNLGPVKEARVRIGDVFRPVVDIQPTQTDTTFKFDMTVEDPNLQVTAVEFQKKTGGPAFDGTWQGADDCTGAWDRCSGTVGADSTLTRGEDVARSSEHLVGIRWRVQYDDADGNNQTLSNVVLYDTDEEAEVRTLNPTINEADGSVIVSAAGDEDTSKIHIRVDENSDPNNPDGSTSDDATINDRVGTVDTGVDISEGSTAHVKAAGENPNGTIGPVREARVQFRTQESAISISDNASVSGNTGTLTVTIDDPQLRLDAVDIAKKTDRGDFGSFSTWGNDDAGDSGTVGSDTEIVRDEDITLKEALNVGIKYRAQWTDFKGNSREDARVVMFDTDEIAEVNSLQATIDESDGTCIVSGSGDEDTKSIHIRVGDGSIPNDPDGSTSDDGVIDARTGSDDTGVTISVGNTAHVKARGSIDSDANTTSSDLGPVKETQVFRPKPAPKLTDFDLNSVAENTADDDVTAKLEWEVNAGVTDDMELRGTLYENGNDRVNDASISTSPKSDADTTGADGTIVWSGGEDNAQDTFQVRAWLEDSSGNKIWTGTSNTRESKVV